MSPVYITCNNLHFCRDIFTQLIINQTHHFTPFGISNEGRDIAELPTPQNGSERYSIFGNFLVRPYVETVLLTKLKWITFKAVVVVSFQGINNTATTVSF